jgi:hypothetical protein
MPQHPKRPRDPAQLAKLIIDIATGQAEDPPRQPADAEGKNLDAAALGKMGGRARAESMSPEQRRAGAQRAARLRWAARVK